MSKPRFTRLAPAVLCLLWALAGCPLAEDARFSGLSDGNENAGGTAGDVSGAGLAQPDLLPGCSEPPTGAAWRQRILELVNQQRELAGVPPVVYSPQLEAQANQYACELIAYDFFDHVNPVTGSTLADRAAEFGYDFLVIGENLAGGQPTPEQAMADWMNSPGHRRNILDERFTELGVGVRLGGDFRIYWVQEFGLPADGGLFGSADARDSSTSAETLSSFQP